MKRRENAQKVGLPESVWQEVSAIPNDYSGANRRRILLAVMAAGFIRMRGHGTLLAFEFTAATADALRACSAVLREIAGPFLRCRFNNLQSNESLELTYSEYEQHIENDVEWILRLSQSLEPDNAE